MSRTFAYVRVSTAGQTTDNQLQEIAAAGSAIEPHRVVTETVSGSVATARRRGLSPSVLGSREMPWRWRQRCRDERVRCGRVGWSA